jgi:protein-tyrosine phosphatase
MKAAIDKGMPVLVHCHAGRQRSAAVIAAYIMKFEGLSLDATLQHMKSRKRDVFSQKLIFGPCWKGFRKRFSKTIPKTNLLVIS